MIWGSLIPSCPPKKETSINCSSNKNTPINNNHARGNWDPWTIFGWRLHSSPFTPPSCSRPQPRNVRVLTSGPPGNSWTDQPRHGQSSHAPAPGEHIKRLGAWCNNRKQNLFSMGFGGVLLLFQKNKLRTCWHLHAKRRIWIFSGMLHRWVSRHPISNSISLIRTSTHVSHYLPHRHRRPANSSASGNLLSCEDYIEIREKLENNETTRCCKLVFFGIESGHIHCIIGSFDLIVPSSKDSNHIKIRFTHNILSS